MKQINKTMIAIYGKEKEGKSSTIIELCRLILKTVPNAKVISEDVNINYSTDINVCIDVDGIKIGIESQGDPGGRQFNTLEILAQKECDIILCTSRTRSKTKHLIQNLAKQYNYNTIWISSFFSKQINYNLLNKRAVDNLLEIIKMIIKEEI